MQNAKLVGTRPGQIALRAVVAVLLVAAVLLLVVRLPAEAQANDRDVGGVTLTSPNPGELVIAWDAPGNAPTDYRVTWKKSDGKWHSYKHANTVDGGNAFPTGTSHTVTGLEEGTAYKARVRARYFNDNGDLEKSGPWSDAVEITISATPSQDGEGDSNEGPSTSPPAKPTGMLTGANHNSVLLSWDNPDDDTITGYQVLRGPDADNLTVLVDDTGDANASYTDSTVEAQTTYVYAVRGRNARGLGPQSDPVTLTTSAAPEEDDPPTSARALAGEDFTLAGQDLDTGDSNCLEDTIGDVTAACTINIDTTTAIFAVDGTLDSNDRLGIKIGRDKAAVDAASNAVDASDLVGADAEATLTFQVGRNLMRLWGDEDGSGGSSSEEHFYRVNVLPYWELNGDRLSKSDDCRSTTDRTAAQITHDDCIVTHFGNTATIRFHNVIKDQFNVYVYLNGTQVIDEPDNTALASSFPLNLQDGDNAVRVRLARKTGDHHAETYGSDRFHYKVQTDVLVSNLGQTSHATTWLVSDLVGVKFTTGNNTGGYTISSVRLSLWVPDGTPKVSIYSDGSNRPGSSLKDLTNPGNFSTTTQTEAEFGADNYRLQPNASYWIVVDDTAYTNSIELSVTESDSEDAGGAPGWNISNTSRARSGATWSDSRTLQIAVKGTVALPNSAPTGQPTISGTPQVGQTLTAVTTNIRDADGLTGASFSYQWIRVDTDGSESEISGAVSSTYRLTGDDEGKRLKVRVSFNDDNSNPEFLTSVATAVTSPSPCTVEGALRFNGSLPAAIDVVIGDSNGTTVTLPSWSGPVCRALVYLGYINSDDVDVFRGDGRPSITSVTFNGRMFSVDQETRELTIQTTSDLPRPWKTDIEFWDTLETYILVPLDNWRSTEDSQYQWKDFFVRFHNLAAPNLYFSRDGRTVRFSGGVDYSTDLFPGRPFNAGGYEIQRCDTSAGCTSDSDWTRVVRTANGQGTDWSLNRTDNVPSASSDYRYRARQHIALRHDGSTYYGPWSREVLLTSE